MTEAELVERIGYATGKVILFGEYAVLEGGPCLVTPSPHLASARFTPLKDAWREERVERLLSQLSPHLSGDRSIRESERGRALLDQDALYIIDAGPLGISVSAPHAQGNLSLNSILGSPLPSFPFADEVLRRFDAPYGLYQVDTSSFGITRAGVWEKMGVGSSGAATVALIDLLSAGEADARFELACEIHHYVQGALGSGADIAASAHRSLIKYRCHPARVAERVTAPLPSTLGVWGGGSCSTTASVREVKRWASREPTAYQDSINALSAACERGLEALSSITPQTAWVDALREGAAAARQLGERAGVQVWTPRHERWSAQIEPLGGVIKPSGAGGDDLSLLTAPSDEALSACVERLSRESGEGESIHFFELPSTVSLPHT